MAMNATNSSSDEYGFVDERSLTVRSIEFSIGLSINIFALTSNILVCATIIRKKDLHSETNKAICSLSITDTFATIFSLVFVVPGQYHMQWLRGGKVCYWYGHILTYVYNTSIYHLILIAFSRLCIIKYNKRCIASSCRLSWSSKCTYIWIALVWLFPILICFPPPFETIDNLDGRFFSCLLSQTGTSYLIINACFGLLIPFAALLIIYTLIFITIRQHKHRIHPISTESWIWIELKVAKMTFTLVITFAAMWTPALLASIFSLFSMKLPHAWDIFVTYCVMLSSAVNPLIYAVINTRIRAGMIETLSVFKKRSTDPKTREERKAKHRSGKIELNNIQVLAYTM